MKPRPPLFGMNWIGESLSQRLVERREPWARIAGGVFAQAHHTLFLPLDDTHWSVTQAIGAAVGVRV